MATKKTSKPTLTLVVELDYGLYTPEECADSLLNTAHDYGIVKSAVLTVPASPAKTVDMLK